MFPMLRTIPNDTHASLTHEMDNEEFGQVKVNGRTVNEEPNRFYIKGMLGYQSTTTEGVQISHQLFPSTDEPLFIDKIEII